MTRRPSECTKCHLPVSWWRSASRDGGWIKVDQSSDSDQGTVQKIVSKDPVTKQDVVYGKVLSGRELADAVSAGELLFTLHKTSCLALKPHNPRPPGVQLNLPKKTTRR